MTAPLDLDAIEARAAAAVEGPWRELYGSMNENGEQCYYVGKVGPTVSVHDITGDGMPLPDAEFIAHAREDVPAPVAEVRRLRAEATQARNALRDFAEHGLRGDLTPTMQFGDERSLYAQFSRYLRRLDEAVRERGRRALGPVAETPRDDLARCFHGQRFGNCYDADCNDLYARCVAEAGPVAETPEQS